MFRLTHEGGWPRCLFDDALYCGERDTRTASRHTERDVELVRSGWHVADCCECPSCPLRVAISGALRLARQA